MPDVPLSLAIISTITPAVAGLAPAIVQWVRDSGKDARDLADRKAAEEFQLKQDKQAECVKLIQAARNFRVLVENGSDSQGAKQVASYALQLRQTAADLAIQADVVGFKVPAAESAASALAAEARALAVLVGDPKNRTAGGVVTQPEYVLFDKHLADFKETARAALGDWSAVAMGSTAPAGALPPPLDATADERRQRQGPGT